VNVIEVGAAINYEGYVVVTKVLGHSVASHGRVRIGFRGGHVLWL